MPRRHLLGLGRTMMESRTSTRQRLVTLVVALLGIALLYLAPGDVALAEDEATPACLRRQDPREVHAKFRRHRLDAHLRCAGADDDGPGARAVLWRHGAQEERGRHRDDQFCGDLPRYHPVRDRDL